MGKILKITITPKYKWRWVLVDDSLMRHLRWKQTIKNLDKMYEETKEMWDLYTKEWLEKESEK